MEMQKHGRKAVRAQNVLGAVRLPEDPGTDVDFEDEDDHAKPTGRCDVHGPGGVGPCTCDEIAPNCTNDITPEVRNRNPNPRRPTGRRGKQ